MARPVLFNELAYRYAGALFDLALESECLERTWEELSYFTGLVEEHNSLSAALGSPVVSREAKEEVLMDLCNCGKFSGLLRRFLRLAARSGHAGSFPSFAAAFSDRLSDYSGRAALLVRTASELGSVEKEEIEDSLGTVCGVEAEIRYETDSDLVGGLQILRGSQLVDVSLRAGLDSLRHSLGTA